MSLKKEIEGMKYDKRLLEWNIRNQVITKKDLEDHLSRLEDKSNASESLSFESNEDEANRKDEEKKTRRNISLILFSRP